MIFRHIRAFAGAGVPERKAASCWGGLAGHVVTAATWGGSGQGGDRPGRGPGQQERPRAWGERCLCRAGPVSGYGRLSPGLARPLVRGLRARVPGQVPWDTEMLQPRLQLRDRGFPGRQELWRVYRLLHQWAHPLPTVTAAPPKALSLFFPVASFAESIFPGDASGKGHTFQSGRHERQGFLPWVGKMPWRRAWPPTPEFLPRQGSRGGYSL